MRTRIRVLWVLFAIGTLMPLLTALVPPKVAAAAQGTWVDSKTIIANDQTFIDDNPYDDNRQFGVKAMGSCDNLIDGFSNGGWDDGSISDYISDSKTATLTIRKIPPGGSCQVVSKTTINLSSPEFARAEFVYTDCGNIDEVNGSLTYYRVGDCGTGADKYLRTSEKGKECQDYIDVKPGNAGIGTFHEVSTDSAGGVREEVTPGCYAVSRVRTVYIAGLDKLAVPAGQGQSTKGGGSGETALNKDSCESLGGVLNWFICPVIELLDSATNWLDSQIQALLITPNPVDVDAGLHTAWGNIRNLALILLVPMMLVMVIATAMGWSFVDAFSVRRAMPRFLIAIIAISLSWYITSFLITITNDVGKGVLGLMTGPFGGANNSLADLIDPKGAIVSTGAGLLIFGGMVTAGVVSFGIIISLAFVAVLALLLGFVILTMRQMFILILVIFAPLAILAWVFPNTERGWKLWWGNFSKLLLMFPLIMALLASGKIFALLLSGAGIYDGSDIIKQMVIIIAYIAPFFFIPATFKMGGQLFGTLAGAISNSTAGIRQGQAKYRAGERGKGWQDFKSGQRGPAPLRRAGFGVGTFLGASRKQDLFTRRGRQEAASQQRKLNMLAYQQTDRAKATKDDDYMLRAQTYATQAEAEANLGAEWGMSADDVQRAVAAARASGGFSAEKANFAARALVATGTGYDNIDQLHKVVSRVAGGNRSMAADILGEANAVTKQVGRHDLAATFQGHMDMYDAAQTRGGYASATGAADILTAGEQRAAYTQAAKDVDAVTFMRDKPRAAGNMADALRESFTAAQAAGDTEEAARLAGFIEKLDQSGTYASTTNVEVVGTRAVTPTSGAGSSVVVPGPNIDPATGTAIPIAVPTAGRQAVVVSGSVSQVQENPVTGRVETVLETDPVTGNVLVDPNTKQPIPAANPVRDAAAGEVYRRNSPASRPNPNDPDF